MYKLKIIQDEDPGSPREWDNLGKMVCFHRRYDLGDEQPCCDPNKWLRELACDLDDSLADRLEYWENGNGWRALMNASRTPSDDADAKIEAAIWKVLDAQAVMLPLYLCDHSGLRMSVGAFSCPWDSGRVGWIYASREDVLKNYGGKKLTAGLRKRAEALLKSEVETYDQYLRGDVHGWAVYETGDDDECDCEPDEECDCTRHAYCEDSCWGYYEVAEALSEGKAHLEWLEKEAGNGTLRGTVQGNREEASRLGNKSSGIETDAAGWRSGVRVRGFVNDDRDDVFFIHATSGTDGNASDIYIGKVVLGADGNPRFIGAQKE